MGMPEQQVIEPAHAVLHHVSQLVPGGWVTILGCAVVGALIIFRKQIQKWWP